MERMRKIKKTVARLLIIALFSMNSLTALANAPVNSEDVNVNPAIEDVAGLSDASEELSEEDIQLEQEEAESQENVSEEVTEEASELEEIFEERNQEMISVSIGESFTLGSYKVYELYLNIEEEGFYRFNFGKVGTEVSWVRLDDAEGRMIGYVYDVTYLTKGSYEVGVYMFEERECSITFLGMPTNVVTNMKTESGNDKIIKMQYGQVNWYPSMIDEIADLSDDEYVSMFIPEYRPVSGCFVYKGGITPYYAGQKVLDPETGFTDRLAIQVDLKLYFEDGFTYDWVYNTRYISGYSLLPVKATLCDDRLNPAVWDELGFLPIGAYELNINLAGNEVKVDFDVENLEDANALFDELKINYDDVTPVAPYQEITSEMGDIVSFEGCKFELSNGRIFTLSEDTKIFKQTITTLDGKNPVADEFGYLPVGDYIATLTAFNEVEVNFSFSIVDRKPIVEELVLGEDNRIVDGGSYPLVIKEDTFVSFEPEMECNFWINIYQNDESVIGTTNYYGTRPLFLKKGTYSVYLYAMGKGGETFDSYRVHVEEHTIKTTKVDGITLNYGLWNYVNYGPEDEALLVRQETYLPYYNAVSGNYVKPNKPISEADYGPVLRLNDIELDIFDGSEPYHFYSSMDSYIGWTQTILTKDGKEAVTDKNGYLPAGEYTVEFSYNSDYPAITMPLVIREVKELETTYKNDIVLNYGTWFYDCYEDAPTSTEYGFSQPMPKSHVLTENSVYNEYIYFFGLDLQAKMTDDSYMDVYYSNYDSIGYYIDSYNKPYNAVKRVIKTAAGKNPVCDAKGYLPVGNYKAIYSVYNGVSVEVPFRIVNEFQSPTAIKLEKSSAAMNLMDEMQMSVTYVPDNTNQDMELTWKSSNPLVVSIDEKTGNMKALKTGTATITATSANGKKATCSITVKQGSSPYTILFDLNGENAVGEFAALDMNYDVLKALPTEVPTRPGYVFTAWNSKANGKGTKYVSGKAVKNLTKEYNGQVTLYAMWKPVTYKVNFNAGKVPNHEDMVIKGRMTPQTMTYAKPVKLKAKAFTTTGGYYVSGWTDSNDNYYADKEIVQNLATAQDDVVELTAVWSPIQYMITYKNAEVGKADVTENINPAYFTVEDDIITSLATPVREGFTFQGWYSDSKYKKPFVEINTKGLKAVTVYAKWTANKYTVNFDGNGATTGTMKSLSKVCGSKFTLPANAFKRTNATFAGWNTQADGQGVTYKNKESVRNLATEDGATVTLYAQWNIKSVE